MALANWIGLGIIFGVFGVIVYGAYRTIGLRETLSGLLFGIIGASLILVGSHLLSL